MCEDACIYPKITIYGLLSAVLRVETEVPVVMMLLCDAVIFFPMFQHPLISDAIDNELFSFA